MTKNTKQVLRNVAIFAISIIIIGGILATFNIDQNKTTTIAKIATEINNNNVKNIIVRGNEIEINYKNTDQKNITTKEPNDSLVSILKDYGVSSDKLRSVPIKIKEANGLNYWMALLIPNILPIILLLAVFWFFFKQVQGQNSKAMQFGQFNGKKADNAKNKITFKDVAGVKEAKEELEEIVDFLKAPDRFTKFGAKIPKGVLLMGSPGTGKTLLARAVSGQAEVPFFHISGSEFVEMFVGVGASRVRDLFSKAKKAAPCIVFIDEIDAVGRQRGSGVGGSHDEREQTLNQILVEMDGFEPNAGVIVIAATNRPDVLDPALLRPGRFDRRIVLNPPDINDREQILTIHSQTKPLNKKISLRKIAERTPGFSGADLMNLMNEAALLTVRRNKKEITEQEILESIEKVMLGPERKSQVMSPQEKKITAYHEVGHALVAHLLPHADPVRKISIISRGRAAGYTINTPMTDRHMRTREEYLEDISVMLGGYAAEKLIFKDITTGASNDMQNATKTARNMVTKWGMSSELGPRVYGVQEDMIFLGRDIHENRDYSESTAEKIDLEINKLIQQSLIRTQEILQQNHDALKRVAEKLIITETLERQNFLDIVQIPPANKDQINNQILENNLHKEQDSQITHKNKKK